MCTVHTCVYAYTYTDILALCMSIRGGSKRAQVIRLSQLSVDELKEQVTSFEHGKV